MVILVCISLVLFRHQVADILPLLTSVASFSSCDPRYSTQLSIYDGSGALFHGPTLPEIQACAPGVNVHYAKGENIGFGSANNFNYRQASLSDSDIFVVANPDVSFATDDLVCLLDWLVSKPSVACLAPLIVGSTGAIQYSAKRNPTVLSLALGRFHGLTRLGFLCRYDAYHRNLDKDYARDCIPCSYLSGCFLIIPSRFYSQVGGFCSQYFLHLEDADLVRRLSRVGEALHNPVGTVTHLWARGSHKSLAQALRLIQSCITYFRIWGLRIF
jgi:GT2 family glycosyltransferase